MKTVLLILAISAVAFFGWTQKDQFLTADAAETAVLEFSRAKRSDLTNTTVATGTVKPKVGAEVKVGSRVSGVLQQLNVSIGDQVKAGDLLAVLDATEQIAQVEQLKAVALARAAELKFAESELERLKGTKFESERAFSEATRLIEVRKSEYKQIQAQIKRERIMLGYSRITAPISGTIASVSTYEGETVAASFAAPTFVTVVDLSKLEVHAYVDESDIAKLSVGQSATLTLDSYPEDTIQGTIRAIRPSAEIINSVVNYVVIIEMDSTDELIVRPEMTARITFVLDQRSDVIVVPRRAILRSGGRDFVYVKEGDDAVKREVKIGAINSSQVEITAGLSQGDFYLANKNQIGSN